jgi:hypothetical protein
MWMFGLAFCGSLFVGAFAWSMRRFRIATRDAVDLVAKLAVPRPVYAVDWPELRVDEVVCDPETPNRALLVTRWPAAPEPAALLLIEMNDPPEPTRAALARWCADGASISPRWTHGGRMSMRRRRTNESVDVLLIEQAIHA